MGGMALEVHPRLVSPTKHVQLFVLGSYVSTVVNPKLSRSLPPKVWIRLLEPVAAAAEDRRVGIAVANAQVFPAKR